MLLNVLQDHQIPYCLYSFCVCVCVRARVCACVRSCVWEGGGELSVDQYVWFLSKYLYDRCSNAI
jgi:hypothetical protein